MRLERDDAWHEMNGIIDERASEAGESYLTLLRFFVFGVTLLCKDIVDQFAMNIGQAIVSSLKAVS